MNRLLGCLTVIATTITSAYPAPVPNSVLIGDPGANGISYLSWDTEGGTKTRLNLLRPGGRVTAQIGAGQDWAPAAIAVPLRQPLGFDMGIAPAPSGEPGGVRFDFPFNPRMTPTAVIPASYGPDGELHFPVVVSAPDFGQMLVTTDNPNAVSHLIGSREQGTEDWIVEFPPPAATAARTPAGQVLLSFRSIVLAPPKGMRDTALWPLARRGWWNMYQPAARWGAQGQPFSAPPGVLANNVVSDPCSVSLFDYADHAFLLPDLAPGISAMTPVRYTLDWWLDKRLLPDGEAPGYWDHFEMLDSDPSLLISAWDYVEATNDRAWLDRHLEQLERMGNYLASRDVDGDGIVEAKSSGNHDTLQQPARSCSSWDAINCGFKDAYCNALIYRGWLCLADLEAKAGRPARQRKYVQLAARLKAAYFSTFFMPKTGRLAWWVSQDGWMHDLNAPNINGLAISYGLVAPEQGRAILKGMRASMAAAGFNRFDLGTPCTVLPVPRADYLQGVTGYGVPQREDGSDTFHQYLNGGCLVADTIWFLNAHYRLGEPDAADGIMNAMLKRQSQEIFPNGGAFQNGVVNAYPGGAEFVTWDGQPCGYEGYLPSTFTFLDAVLLREPEFRHKLFRPLGG